MILSFVSTFRPGKRTLYFSRVSNEYSALLLKTLSSIILSQITFILLDSEKKVHSFDTWKFANLIILHKNIICMIKHIYLATF